MIKFLGQWDCCSWSGRASASSRPLSSVLRWQGCCRACRCPLCLQMRPLHCSADPSVPPFPSNHGAERGKPPQRGEHRCVLASSYKNSARGFWKPKPLWWCCWLCSFLLTLLLTVQSALVAWVLPWGSKGIQGAREPGGMALPEQLERLLSVQHSTQPSIFVSSPVILIFSGLERANRGLPFERKTSYFSVFFFLNLLFQNWFRNKGFSKVFYTHCDLLGTISEADLVIKIFWKVTLLDHVMPGKGRWVPGYRMGSRSLSGLYCFEDSTPRLRGETLMRVNLRHLHSTFH